MPEDTNMAYTNEGLAVEIKNISVQIIELKALIASMSSDYVRKEIFELKIKEIDLKIAEVEKSTKKANWRSHTLTAFLTIISTLLITYVFNDLIAR